MKALNSGLQVYLVSSSIIGAIYGTVHGLNYRNNNQDMNVIKMGMYMMRDALAGAIVYPVALPITILYPPISMKCPFPHDRPSPPLQ
jgi:hypothetical protein